MQSKKRRSKTKETVVTVTGKNLRPEVKKTKFNNSLKLLNFPLDTVQDSFDN